MQGSLQENLVPFDPMPEVIAAVAAGELVIVTDDEQRENEGDLIGAAELITPENINFMARFGRGLICVAMTAERLGALDILPARKRGSRDHFNTAFMEPVDAHTGISTGISAMDRAHTVRLLMDPAARPDDLVHPGHVFPLQADPKGVQGRKGHTEAAVELAQLAGCQPGGVICEIIRDDGDMARLPDLTVFAQTHGLKMTSVALLLDWLSDKKGAESPTLEKVNV